MNTIFLTFIFLLTLSFYIFTLAPTVTWGDPAKLVIFSKVIKLGIPTEYHPLHTLIGIIFNFIPIGDIAFRQNFMSCLFASISIMVLGVIILKITNSYIASFLSSISLVISHIFFLLSVINETYSFLIFSIFLAIYCFILYSINFKNYLIYPLFFFLGVSFWNSNLIIFLLPPFLVFLYLVDKESRWIKIFISLLLFLSGLLLILLIIFLKEPFHETKQQLIFCLKGGPFFQYYQSPLKLATELIKYPVYLFYQFPLVGSFLGILGIFKMLNKKKKIFILLFLIFLIDIIFAAGYMRQRQFNLLIVSFAIFAIWIGVGISYLIDKLTKFRTLITILISIFIIVTPLILYLNMKILCKRFNIDLVKTRTIPYRDNTEFFLNPNKRGEFGAYKFANEVFNVVKPNSVIITDYVPGIVLEYYQIVEKKRSDIIISKCADYPFNYVKLDYINNIIKNHPVYFVEADELEKDYNLDEIKKYYRFIPTGCIFELKRKEVHK